MNEVPKISAGKGSGAKTVSAQDTVGKSLRRRKRVLPAGILGLALVVLVVFSGKGLMVHFSRISVDDARIAATIVTVSSEVSGRIVAIPVTGGDAVNQGAPLVSVDPKQAELLVKGVEARLSGVAAHRAQLRTQQDMIRTQIDSRMAAARAQIAAAEANHQSSLAGQRAAQSRFNRTKALAAHDVASEQEQETVQAALDTAHQQELATAAAIETARANLAVIKADAAQIAVIDRQIDTLAADQAALESERAQKQIDLAQRELFAAFSGVVDATFVDAGEYVTPGTRLLMYHDPHRVWVEANVKETEFRSIHIGAQATVTVDAYPGREFHGTVNRLGGAANSQFALLPSPNPSGNFTKVTQRMPIRVSIDPQDAVLSPGMMVELRINVTN